MAIVLQGKVEWFDKNKNLILVGFDSVYQHPDVDKIKPGQKVTIILEQRKSIKSKV